MKRRDGICLWAPAAILIAIFVLAQVGAAQEEKPDRPAAASLSATIYPVPNYGGEFWSRSYLTGD
jgi:hypothetical protein